MHYHMQHEQYRQVIAVCERHGEQEPSLWEQALSYFARKEEDCKEYVAAVLKHIESKNLMPPLLGILGGRLGGYVGTGCWRSGSGAGVLQLCPESCVLHGFASSHLSGADPGPQLHSHPVCHPGLPGPKTAETEPADRPGRAPGAALPRGDHPHPPGDPGAEGKVLGIQECRGIQG